MIEGGHAGRLQVFVREIAVNFDGREITCESGELDGLALALATTIHRAKGSEYPAAVLPVPTQHYALLYRSRIVYHRSVSRYSCSSL